MSVQGNILFIDAYDSFSNNIISLLRHELDVSVEVIKIDDPRFLFNQEAYVNFLRRFDAVVAGPGPGHPKNAANVGLIAKLWNLPQDDLLPVLGICLGFQSLCLAFGAKVERLEEPRHGLVTSLQHCGQDVYADTADTAATQYHSLRVSLGADVSQHGQGSLRWKPSRSCDQLVPLAWDATELVNGPILMAVRHCHLPFWGVQYHPESICTNEEGRKVIVNWWREVCKWHIRRPSQTSSRTPTVLNKVQDCAGLPSSPVITSNSVHWRAVTQPDQMDIPEIMSCVRQSVSPDAEPLLLESGMREGKLVNAETGRFSIIGVPDAQSVHIRYSTSRHTLDVMAGGETLMNLDASITDVFAFLEEWMTGHRAIDGPEDVPFWGGLIGFISYEAGLETIGVDPSETEAGQPDVWFVFVDRSVVVDHVNHVIYMQSIRRGDDEWLDLTGTCLRQPWIERHACSAVESPLETSCPEHVIASPLSDEYKAKVRQCQSYLRAGSSYELCLTDTTHLRTDRDAWSLYKRLRTLNPAPFAAYFRMTGCDTTSGVEIISSSPERFLSWSRGGRCQFRPIKGTLKKTDGVDRAVAEKVLSSPKERAENLMIVDLIRHDLSGVEGVQNVSVPKLMSIEEYQTVFQLTSIIEGDAENGIAVLAASLPPGSMTGAPKKRSCDLLKSIERDAPRGLYSGVIGYFDVGGGGDFSVVIRSASKWSNHDEWRVGAGGAVTVLSSAEGEWEEMIAKRASVLQAFS